MPYIKNDPTATPTPTLTPTATFTPTPTAAIDCSPPNTLDSSDVGKEEELIIAVNNARDDDNKSQLNRAEELVQAARIHSTDMRNNAFVDNRGSDGEYGPDRIEDQCYFLAEDQEIVWSGTFDTADDLVESWLENTFWRRAMLDGDMEDIGVGYILSEAGSSDGEELSNLAYITVSFARRLVAATQTPTPSPTPPTSEDLSQFTASACLLHLSNEMGSGSILLRNTELCTAALTEATARAD
ncbi:MAG: CAP domain-containing protein [Chloroflexota bacterium]